MAKDLMSENPSDMTVVDLLVLVFNSLDRREKATELYEQVFLQNPTTEIGIILF
jgi:hypothetical protein